MYDEESEIYVGVNFDAAGSEGQKVELSKMYERLTGLNPIEEIDEHIENYSELESLLENCLFELYNLKRKYQKGAVPPMVIKHNLKDLTMMYDRDIEALTNRLIIAFSTKKEDDV